MTSLLERLINEKPSELHMSVQRDLENLLNTRASCLSWREEWENLNTSLVAYGVPDFMSSQLAGEQAQYEFCKKLRALILHYDPRFKAVEVMLLSNAKANDSILRLHIEGLLYAEPVPEPIIFDSIINNR